MSSLFYLRKVAFENSSRCVVGVEHQQREVGPLTVPSLFTDN